MNISELNRIRKVLKKQLQEIELRMKKYLTDDLLIDTSIERKTPTFEQQEANDKIFFDLCTNYRATLKLLFDLERKK